MKYMAGDITYMIKLYIKTILFSIVSILIIFQISCGQAENLNETTISDNILNSSAAASYIDQVILENGTIKAENEQFLNEINMLKSEIERIKQEFEIEIENYKAEIERIKNEFADFMDKTREIETKTDDTYVSPVSTESPKNQPENIVDAIEEVAIEKNSVLYILNKSTKKFHLSACSSAARIKAENYAETNSREYAINQGYEACKICNP